MGHRMKKKTEILCERCGRRLNPAATVWLERNALTGEFFAGYGAVRRAESMGRFPFGKDCAKAAAVRTNRKARKYTPMLEGIIDNTMVEAAALLPDLGAEYIAQSYEYEQHEPGSKWDIFYFTEARIQIQRKGETYVFNVEAGDYEHPEYWEGSAVTYSDFGYTVTGPDKSEITGPEECPVTSTPEELAEFIRSIVTH